MCNYYWINLLFKCSSFDSWFYAPVHERIVFSPLFRTFGFTAHIFLKFPPYLEFILSQFIIEIQLLRLQMHHGGGRKRSPLPPTWSHQLVSRKILAINIHQFVHHPRLYLLPHRNFLFLKLFYTTPPHLQTIPFVAMIRSTKLEAPYQISISQNIAKVKYSLSVLKFIVRQWTLHASEKKGKSQFCV